ncbi:hypothetical protein AhyVDH1_059 [Aeromonas phage AhyVDH1]|nr:hypothetical protein AhyVDH1_059 [Aeromonas phage AhyVDH1]
MTLPVVGVSIATGERFTYPSIAAACREGGFQDDCVALCVKGLARHHAGFKWHEEGKEDQAPTPSPQVMAVAELRNAGHTNREIAAIMGVSYGQIRVYAARAVVAGLCKSRKKGERV